MHEAYNYTNSEGVTYSFRSLNITELKRVESMVSSGQPSFDVENFLLSTCLLDYDFDPEDDDMLPGDGRAIADMILQYSGASDLNFLQYYLNKSRDELSNDLVHTMKTYIISAIPAYTDKDLDEFTLLQLIEKSILAESILQLQCQLSGIDTEIRLTLQVAGEDEEPQAPAKAEAPKVHKSQEKLSKEELLKRIAQENKEEGFTAYNNPNGLDEFQGFDEELLRKMEGTVDPEDPIAAKLFADPKTQEIINP